MGRYLNVFSGFLFYWRCCWRSDIKLCKGFWMFRLRISETPLQSFRFELFKSNCFTALKGRKSNEAAKIINLQLILYVRCLFTWNSLLWCFMQQNVAWTKKGANLTIVANSLQCWIFFLLKCKITTSFLW